MRDRRLVVLIAGLAIVVAGCSGSTATVAPATTAPSLPALGTTVPAPATPSAASAAPTAAPAATATPTDTPAPTPAATETPAPTETPVATTAPTESPSPSATPLPSAPSLVDVAASLSHLKSYVEDFVQQGGKLPVSTHLVVVRSPAIAEELDLTDNSTTRRIFVIGRDTWYDSGTGKALKNVMPLASAQASINVYDPGVFLRSLSKSGELQLLPVVGVETKNGVQALHLHADSSTNLGPNHPTIPPGAQFDVWVSTDNDYLVAVEYQGVKTSSGATLSGSIELTNVNDPSVSVSQPG